MDTIVKLTLAIMLYYLTDASVDTSVFFIFLQRIYSHSRTNNYLNQKDSEKCM